MKLHERLYESPICEVYRAEYNGKIVAMKKFEVNSLAFVQEEFWKEVALQW